MTLTEFLTARIDEDEAVARAATAGPWVEGVTRDGEPGRWRGVKAYSVLSKRTDGGILPELDAVADSQQRADVDHIARHDPAHVLREVEAKRAVMAALDLGPDTWDYENTANPENSMHEIDRDRDHELACRLAAVYSDHDDFQEEWRP